MARSDRGVAGVHLPEMDGELGGFLVASHAPYGHGTGVRFCAAGRLDRGISSSPPRGVSPPWLGARITRGGVGSLSAADRRCFPLELSLASFGPSRSGSLRRRVVTNVC